MNVLQEFNDTDYHPDYGMPWAPWFEYRDRYGNWHSSSDESYKITGRWVLVGDFKEVYDQTPVGTNYPHNGKDYQWRNNAGQNETTGKTVTAQVDGKVIATGYDANVKGNYVRTQDAENVNIDVA